MSHHAVGSGWTRGDRERLPATGIAFPASACARRMLAVLVVCVGCTREPADSPSPLVFTDVTTAAGIRIDDDTWGTFGAAWGDYDNDGHVDLFVSRHSVLPALLRNTGRGTFVDVTKAAGLNVGFLKENLNLLDRHGCAWGDSDGDGFLDLYCSTGAEGGQGSTPNQLFHNTGDGTFADVAALLGVDDGPGRGRAVNWIDYDKDGRLDLYVANTRRPTLPSKLFRGVGRTFQDRTAESGLGDEVELLGGGGSWCDYDGDGFTDLFLAGYGGVVLHRNRHDGTFAADGASAAGIASSRVRSVTCDDVDRDGSPDLFVASVDGPARLLRNRGDGTFADATADAGVDVQRAMAGVFGDFDNDGDVDLFVVRGFDPQSQRNLPDALFANDGDGTFTDVAAGAGVVGPTSGSGDSAAVADFDGDGFLDLLVTDGACQPDTPDGPMFAPIPAEWFPPGGIITYPRAPHGAVTLFRNSGNANHWFALRLFGRDGKGSVHGAQVSLHAGGRRQVATLGDGVANYGQSDRLLHFGLGRTREVDEVTIRWPDGRRQSLTELGADRVHEVMQETPR